MAGDEATIRDDERDAEVEYDTHPGTGRGLAACDHAGLVDQIEEEPDHERDRGGAAQVLPAAHDRERRRALSKWFRDICRAQSNTRINSAAPDQRVRGGPRPR